MQRTKEEQREIEVNKDTAPSKTPYLVTAWRHASDYVTEDEKPMNFFEQIANIMNADTARRIARKTGLSKDRVYRIAQGCSFCMNESMIDALHYLGYEISITPTKKK